MCDPSGKCILQKPLTALLRKNCHKSLDAANVHFMRTVWLHDLGLLLARTCLFLPLLLFPFYFLKIVIGPTVIQQVWCDDIANTMHKGTWYSQASFLLLMHSTASMIVNVCAIPDLAEKYLPLFLFSWKWRKKKTWDTTVSSEKHKLPKGHGSGVLNAV